MGDSMTAQELRSRSFAKRVFAPEEADVIFVPFFGTISAELQLGVAKGVFRKKVGNEDYARQREVLDFVKGTDAWKRSGGRDHVFVLTENIVDETVCLYHGATVMDFNPLSIQINKDVEYGNIHEYPELGFEKYKASDFIRNELNELNTSYIYPLSHTGFVAQSGTGLPSGVAIRADMDALPLQALVASFFALVCRFFWDNSKNTPVALCFCFSRRNLSPSENTPGNWATLNYPTMCSHLSDMKYNSCPKSTPVAQKLLCFCHALKYNKQQLLPPLYADYVCVIDCGMLLCYTLKLSLADPVAMSHVRDEIAPSILLVVDFGGWYRVDLKASNGSSSDMIQHTQVSVLKDVIVPYTHMLPRLDLLENQKRQTLLYFKGAKHRHRGGLVREKLWDLLINEPGVIMEEGFPNATGKEQSIKGMRTSEFCLHPAGDTPTSCRLFDAIQSLCIPVIVSDNIELPFEGIIDYTEFSVFIAASEALQPNWLVNHLKSYTDLQKSKFRQNMARVQSAFEYDNGYPSGVGPIPLDGAVNHIWRKVHQKLPMIKEAIVREKRKPLDVSVPRRCQCT
ncbi:exostosin family protein [Artemisia annua]|uniref:Exostosin family protein n=1 Tax=Artemisia annua TaxID=35608 RepID=A0A2U1L386_ARTAN|nr:exostosin family protein [Artemisia annua]